MKRQKILLHMCCGPCSTHCVTELKKKYDVTLHFFNPNIHPRGEYERRLDSAKKVAEKMNISIIEDHYCPDEWLKLIKGLENEPEGGHRCRVCFAMRLRRAAKIAKKKGFTILTTTLSVSPHKDSEMINKIGKDCTEEEGLDWLHADFKKNDGFRKSTELSKKFELYRQKYCGCFYSIPDPNQ